MGRPSELVSRAASHTAAAVFPPRPILPAQPSAVSAVPAVCRQNIHTGGAYRDIMQKHDRVSARHIHP